MDKSPVIEEWIAKGELLAGRKCVLRALRIRCRRPVPRDLAAAVEGMTDIDELDQWLVASLHVNTYTAFRAAIER